MFSDTAFRFAGIKPQTYILRLQDVQYQPYDTVIAVVEGTNVLKTPLVLKPATLGEVVVRGARPVLKYSHGNISVDVANSYLKDDFSVANILGKLPGLIVHNESIGMFGKKSLRIYINGVQRSVSDLNVLQPGDVDRIEIIRNVGVEYESGVDAVIKIQTKKRREEKYHVFISDKFQLSSNYLNNGSNFRLYLGNHEKLAQYISLTNNFIKIEGQNISSSYTYFEDYTNSQFRDSHFRNRNGGPWLSYFLNWSINKNAELGFQCRGSFNNSAGQVNGTWNYDDETANRTGKLHSDNETASVQSGANLNYRQKIGMTGELSVIADYATRNTDKTTDVKESSGYWNANNITDADNKGNVFSITPEYKIKGKKFAYSTGLKYISLHSKSATEYRPSMDVEHTRLSEYSTGAYTVFDAQLSFVDIKSGIRLEYTNSSIRSDDVSNNLNRDYFNWVPYISLSRELNKHLNLTAYYRQNLKRPGLPLLNSTVNYVDSLSYTKGNPGLKAVTTDVFGFNAGVYKFDFMLEYRIDRDEIIPTRISDSENPNISVNTYTNKKEKSGYLTVGISYLFNSPVFTSMTSFNYGKQFGVTMPFRNEIIRFDKPKYYFQTSGNVNVFKNTSLNYYYRYNDSGDNNYTRTHTLNNRLEFEVSQYFMNRKLLVAFMVYGILFSNNEKRTAYYNGNNIIRMQDLDPSKGTMSLRIRYNWGVNKSIQQKSSNSDIGRL
jgi:hypothetical protein